MEDVEVIKARLASVPWCQRLLNDKSLTIHIPESRRHSRDREDGAIGETLYTADTIPSYLVLYQVPSQPETIIKEILGLLQVGDGLSGWPGVLHGGIVATIMDEVIGEIINVNKKHQAIRRASYMTAYLNITYVRPVAIPGTILVRAILEKVDGRKLNVSATVEDGQGTVLTKAEGLFVGLKQNL
jgi:acyl-coenzyme A thioesterase PaaI-like protein